MSFSFFHWKKKSAERDFCCDLSRLEFCDLSQKENVITVDIRTPLEISKIKPFPLAQELDFSSPDFQEKIAQIPKEKIVLLYCRSGTRSKAAVSLLKKMGFSRVAHLQGGLLGISSS